MMINPKISQSFLMQPAPTGLHKTRTDFISAQNPLKTFPLVRLHALPAQVLPISLVNTPPRTMIPTILTSKSSWKTKAPSYLRNLWHLGESQAILERIGTINHHTIEHNLSDTTTFTNHFQSHALVAYFTHHPLSLGLQRLG